MGRARRRHRPHGLIAAFHGDTVKAAQVFADRFHDEMNITVLVDFENDSVRTAVEVAKALGPKLWGVRLDTSERMVDRSLFDSMGDFDPRGVNPQLVHNVRRRWTTPATRASRSSRAAASRPRRSSSSRRSGCRWMPTASAPR